MLGVGFEWKLDAWGLKITTRSELHVLKFDEPKVRSLFFKEREGEENIRGQLRLKCANK